MSQPNNNGNPPHSTAPEDTPGIDNVNSNADPIKNSNLGENYFPKTNDTSVYSHEDNNAGITETTPNGQLSTKMDTSGSTESKSVVADASAQSNSESISTEPIVVDNENDSTTSTSVEQQKPRRDDSTSDTQHSLENGNLTSESVTTEQTDNDNGKFLSVEEKHDGLPSQTTNDQIDADPQGQTNTSTLPLNNNNDQITNRTANITKSTLSDLDNFSASGGEHENEDHLDSSTDITDKQEECNKHPMNEGVSRNAENEEKAKHCLKCASVQSNDQAINEATSSDNIKIKEWLALHFHDQAKEKIKKPDENENEMPEAPNSVDEEILDRIKGSMIGMALGDALGAHVEFRPRQYLVANPVKDLEGGGTWGLQKGQFTDDTSMALCLANSLVVFRDFNPYDQLVRYKWWYRHGYMSSTGRCFDIGNATRQSIIEFEHRQREFAREQNISDEQADFSSGRAILERFDVNCSEDGVAGNGALMRLAPVPLFFYKYPCQAVEYSGQSGRITHGDDKAYDACRFYGALIVAALHGHPKKELLSEKFYSRHEEWFGGKELHPDIKLIAEGSYKKKKNYEGGIRGKGYIVSALEAALWAFWSDEDSFEQGALNAVNLGDDTDTTAAIYGQLAGAYYGHRKLPSKWLEHVYAHLFLKKLSKWIAYEGQCWRKAEKLSVE